MNAPAMTENSLPPVAASASRKAALWIAAVFILGAALGGVSGYLFGHRASVAAAPAQMSEDAKRHQKVAQLTSALVLTTEQQTQIDAIFNETSGQFQSVRQEAHKQADAQIEVLRQRARDRIRAVLTPEQLPKFEAYLLKLDADRKNRPQPTN
jgi:Spy/CpxP family protein refolding chaperone